MVCVVSIHIYECNIVTSDIGIEKPFLTGKNCILFKISLLLLLLIYDDDTGSFY